MSQQKTIDALWPIARAIGLHIQEWHQPHRSHADAKNFTRPNWDGNGYMSAGFSKPGTIEYRLNPHADVRICGIDVGVVKPDDIFVGPIEPTGDQRVVKAEVISTLNDALDPILWELTHRDLISTTASDKVAKEVGASLAVGLRQQIGYGSEIAQISGETEITVNMEASVKAAWEREMTSTRESEVTGLRKITIGGMHRGFLERVETVGPARQIIRAKGALQFGVFFHSSGNWHYMFDDLDTFLALLGGLDVQKGITDNHGGFPGGLKQFYRTHPVPQEKLGVFRQTIYAESEKKREFEEASNIDVVIRAEPLNDVVRLQDAYRLVALKTANPEAEAPGGRSVAGCLAETFTYRKDSP